MKIAEKGRNQLKKRQVSIPMVLCLFLISGPGFSQNNNTCSISTDNKGNFTSMTVSNPRTPLSIEKTYNFEVDNQGTPVKGTVTFVNGFERELKTPEELSLMWAQFGGPRTFWDFIAKQKKTVSYTSINDLSSSVFGKQSRVFLQDGKDFIGKLKPSSKPESFLLEVGATSPLQIDKIVLREIQQIK